MHELVTLYYKQQILRKKKLYKNIPNFFLFLLE